MERECPIRPMGPPNPRRVRNGVKTGHGAREAADSRRSERLGQAVGNHVLGRAVEKTNGAGVNYLLT